MFFFYFIGNSCEVKRLMRTLKKRKLSLCDASAARECAKAHSLFYAERLAGKNWKQILLKGEKEGA